MGYNDYWHSIPVLYVSVKSNQEGVCEITYTMNLKVDIAQCSRRYYVTTDLFLTELDLFTFSYLHFIFSRGEFMSFKVLFSCMTRR